VAPILELFAGPVGTACLLSGALVAALRLVRGRLHLGGPGLPAVLAGGLALYLGVGLYYTSRLAPSGDEPEYLLMAQSLWRDHDLVVADNWERRDWREYTPGMPLPEGPLGADERPRPARPPGLPLLLAPAYALAGRPGVTALLALVAVLAVALSRALAALLSGDPEARSLATLAALGPPLLFYAFHAYPEGLSAVALALSLWLLLTDHGNLGAALSALAASMLPWLHLRMAPAAVALAVVALLRLRGRRLAAFAVVAGLAAGAFLAYHWIVFDDPSPLVLYGGRLPRHVKDATPLAAAFGLWLDRSFGLLPYAPVFLLAVAGLPALVRRGTAALPWLLVAVGVLAPLLPWKLWFGGFCPPGRFLVPLVPVLAALVALRLEEGPFGLARWRFWLVVAGFGLAALMLAEPGQMLLLNVKERPPYLWRALVGEAWSARYLPAFTSRGPEAGRIDGVWVAAVTALMLLDRLAARWRWADRLFRSPALPVAGLVLIGVAIDHWALE